jgi:predicted TIM-barrel fold metal-dependent hydrolase
MKTDHKIPFALFIPILVIGSLSCSKENATEPDPGLILCIDAHSQPPYPEIGDNVDLPSIIQDMDQNNVSISILSARVEMKYSEDIGQFAENYSDRIVAAASLKLTCMNSDTGFINTLNRQVETGKFKAIAEMLLYHAEKFSNGISVAPEVMVRPTDPKVEAVINACAQLNCPVILHIEFGSLENDYGAGIRTQFMNELIQILTSYSNQKFLLAHVAELYPEQCRNLIEAHQNIYFATNYKDLENLCTGEPVSDYSESDWITLFNDCPDRFIFAFDRVFPNQWNHYSQDMATFQEKLSNMPESVAKAIAYENARRLFNL